jgi:ankyrin repeat protein
MSEEFLDAVRAGNWSTAHSLIRNGAVSQSINTPSSSIYEWLVECNAPPPLIADLLRLHPQLETLPRAECGLMEACLRESLTKSNAFDTFSLLLKEGVSPNLVVESGSTLLQLAMQLNRVREVRELLRHGVDPNQMSIFGQESTSNLEEAAKLANDAAKLVLDHFAREKP